MAAPDTSLETLIGHLKAPDVVTSHDVDPKVLAAGLEDLKNRVGHAEFSHLKALSQLRANSDRLAVVETNVAGLGTDRDEFRKQVRTAVDAPVANAAKITELEARVYAVEGAVGAAPYKVPKSIEPAKPVGESDKPVVGSAKPASVFIDPFPTPAPTPTPATSHSPS